LSAQKIKKYYFRPQPNQKIEKKNNISPPQKIPDKFDSKKNTTSQIIREPYEKQTFTAQAQITDTAQIVLRKY